MVWLLAQQPWIVPIPGTRRLERLEENLAAAAVELTADDLGEIERAAAQIQVQGARYPDHLQRLNRPLTRFPAKPGHHPRPAASPNRLRAPVVAHIGELGTAGGRIQVGVSDRLTLQPDLLAPHRHGQRDLLGGHVLA
jgi:Aldo/keto reductase family